jgi:hypothetical protein
MSGQNFRTGGEILSRDPVNLCIQIRSGHSEKDQGRSETA